MHQQSLEVARSAQLRAALAQGHLAAFREIRAYRAGVEVKTLEVSSSIEQLAENFPLGRQAIIGFLSSAVLGDEMQSSPRKQFSPLIKAILTGTGVAAGATLLLLTLSNLGAIAKRPIQDWAALAGMAGVIGTGAVVAHEKLTGSAPAATRRLTPSNPGPVPGGREVAMSLGENITKFEPGTEAFNQVLFASRDFLGDYSRAVGETQDYQPVFEYEERSNVHAINQSTSANPSPAPQLPEAQQQPLRIPLSFPDVSEDEPEPDTLTERDRPDSVPSQTAQAQLEDLDPIDWSAPPEPTSDPFEALRRIGNSGGVNGSAGGFRQSA